MMNLFFLLCILLILDHTLAAATITEIDDWQLISSSETTVKGPGVKTYMKAYPGGSKSLFCNKIFG
jgi:hypothetical protein